MNENKFRGALFADFAKAFGDLEHDLLRRKLLLSGITDESYKLIAPFLTYRQVVCIDASKSTAWAVSYGVSQGSTLGLILFLFW